jgi:hypothetical protein
MGARLELLTSEDVVDEIFASEYAFVEFFFATAPPC